MKAPLGNGLFSCWLLGVATVLVAGPAVGARASEVAPAQITRIGTRQVGRYSERTVVAAFVVNRDAARLLAFTLKPYPYERVIGEPDPQPFEYDNHVQVEVVMLGPGGTCHTSRLDIGRLCLAHPAGTDPHVEGDTILVHGDSFAVELPELAGYDRVEIAYYRSGPNGFERRLLATESLDASRFVAAGGPFHYADAAFAAPAAARSLEGALATSGHVSWPEDYGDPDIYQVYGDAAETGRRINIVIVPDGYAYTDKALMQSHAAALVAAFRARTPFKEHDLFLNYILVYAYSTESGTDQCDCNIVKDTAMGTRFPNAGYPCGDSGNRCLYYGSGCDTDSSANIAAAELRAPARDVTIVMVNTTRYGGCGGSRAVYAAGNSSAQEIAIHELGHALAGLADEYTSYTGCGAYAGEINTSRDSANGAWPELISDLGAPRLGAQYYPACIYRPLDNCEMRALNQPFCPVCQQRWALVVFGHSRISPTAPIETTSPASAVRTLVGSPVDFAVATRLATGPTNTITWQLQGPGIPSPITVLTGTSSCHQSFTTAGNYTLTCEVIGDANMVKPAKTGANRDLASWQITALDLPAISISPGASSGTYWLSLGNLASGQVYSVQETVTLDNPSWNPKTNFAASTTSTNILISTGNSATDFLRVGFAP